MKSTESAGFRATIEDLRQTPEDGQKYELVDGEIQVSPTGMRHSKVGTRIGYLLLQASDETNAGEVYAADVGIIPPNGNLRSPDVSFIRTERLPEGETPEDFGKVIPDLVVEVLSPNDRMRQVADKIGEFLDCGVGLIWLVDPESRSVTVYRSLSNTEHLEADQTITADTILPGFSAKVSEFFR